MCKFIVKFVNSIFTILIFFILGASIVSFSNYVANGMFAVIVGVVTVGILILFIYSGSKIFDKVKSFLYNYIVDLSPLKMGLILFFTVSITKIFFVFLFDIDANLHPDMKNYLSFATQIANDGVITENAGSALKWPYEVIFGLFLSPAVKLFGNDTQVLTTYLSICFAISTVLLFDIIKKYVGKNLAFVGLMLFNLLPVGLFETQLLIHENALIFFYILSFWLLQKVLEGKYRFVTRCVLICLSSVLIAFGNKINQGGTVVIISYCIYAVIIMFKNGIRFKNLLKVFAIVLCYVVAFFGISNLCSLYVNNVVDKSSNQIVDKEKYAVPLGWGLYLGANYEHSGVWNREDADKYNKYQDFDNEKDAVEYQTTLINERLQIYKDSPLLVISHLFNKLQALWGDPFLPFVYEQGNSVNDFVNSGFGGIINKTLYMITYLSFVFICTIILFSNKVTKKNKNLFSPVIQFELMIIGITIVLILFEVMPKYVSHLQIILFTIALFRMSDFCINSKNI